MSNLKAFKDENSSTFKREKLFDVIFLKLLEMWNKDIQTIIFIIELSDFQEET